MQRIQQAIRYMEEHILENITYADAAKSVHMSGHSFHRTFRFITGITPAEYIRSRRLSLAGQELQETDISVLEVSLKYGYESPESFSKAFSRFHGTPPKLAKRKGACLRLFNPFVIKITIGGGNVMDYRIEHKEKQRFLILAKNFFNDSLLDSNGHSIVEFWEECHKNDQLTPMLALRPKGKQHLYGICSPTKNDETYFAYGIGVIADSETDSAKLEKLLAEGCVLWQTEPADYAVFQCFGSDGNCISETWDKFFKEFLPQTGYVQVEGADYELYFEKPRKGLFCELWIPVKKPDVSF